MGMGDGANDSITPVVNPDFTFLVSDSYGLITDDNIVYGLDNFGYRDGVSVAGGKIDSEIIIAMAYDLGVNFNESTFPKMASNYDATGEDIKNLQVSGDCQVVAEILVSKLGDRELIPFERDNDVNSNPPLNPVKQSIPIKNKKAGVIVIGYGDSSEGVAGLAIDGLEKTDLISSILTRCDGVFLYDKVVGNDKSRIMLENGVDF